MSSMTALSIRLYIVGFALILVAWLVNWRLTTLEGRIDRLELTHLVCHPIQDGPSGDRVCVRP